MNIRIHKLLMLGLLYLDIKEDSGVVLLMQADTSVFCLLLEK